MRLVHSSAVKELSLKNMWLGRRLSNLALAASASSKINKIQKAGSIAFITCDNYL